MKRHILWGTLGTNDLSPTVREDDYTQVTTIPMLSTTNTLEYGVGQAINELKKNGLRPSEVGIDLALLSALVTAADTRISRDAEAQDTWTREIDIYLPVSNVDLWENVNSLIREMLKFLTGDIWRIKFRKRPSDCDNLAPLVGSLGLLEFSSVSLFSGGLDSYIGAIDLFEENKESSLFISHYWDQSTSNQEDCAQIIRNEYNQKSFYQIRSRVGFNNGIIKNVKGENTLRGRSFLFFALAALAASCSDEIKKLFIPENGLISLNVPLDPLRLGAWSTRTTHPYYLARWNDLLKQLGLGVHLVNPYRFKTKGEMVEECLNQTFLKKTYMKTLSCSSVSKARWEGNHFGHCGHCVPCIIRRTAIEHAYEEDLSGYLAVPSMDTTTILDTQKAEGVHVRSFQLMKAKLAKKTNAHTVLVHKSGPLNDYPDADVQEYAEVFRRGIDEVDAILRNVTAKPL